MTGRTVVRRLRRDGRTLRLAYVGLVFVVAATSVVTPLVLADAADHTLRSEISQADDQTRTITVRQVVPFRGWRQATGASEAAVAATHQQLLAGMAPLLRRLVGSGTYGVQTATYAVTDAQTGQRPDLQSRQNLLLRAQSEALDRVDWLRGAPPRGFEPVTVEGAQVPRVEVGLAAGVAAALNVDVGDRLVLTPERFDRGLAVEVTGIFTPSRPDPWFWAAEPRVLVPDVQETANTRVITAVALFAPDVIDVVDAAAAQSLEVDHRFPLVIDRLTTGSASDAVVALGRFTAFVRQDVGPSFDAGSRFPAAVEAFDAELSTTTALLSIAVVGLAAVAGAAVGVLAWLVVARRSATLTLLRARGASLRDVALLVPRECAPVLVPVAVTGLGMVLLARGPTALVPVIIAAGCTVGGLALPAGVVLVRHRRLVTDTAGAGDRGAYRLTVELTLAVVAIGGVVLLTQAGPSVPGLAGVRAVVPTLLVLLVGLLVLRGATALLRRLRKRATRTSSAAGLVGLSSLTRDRVTAVLPVLVLVQALAMATFGLVIVSSLAGVAPLPGSTPASSMVSLLRVGLALAALGSAVFAVVAFTLAQLGGRAHRAHQHNLLRTLGVPRRDGRRLAMTAWLPLAGVALVAGVLAGLAIAALVLWSVDLSPFTGGTTTPYRIDLVWLGLLVGTFVLLAAAVVVAETVADRHRLPTIDLRAGAMT